MGFLGDLPHPRWVSPYSIRVTGARHPSLVGGFVAAAALAALVWRAMAGPASGSESRIVSVGTPVPGLAADDRRYALIVAVEGYDDASLPSLRGARGGATDLHDALVTHAGFRPDHIRRVDGSGPEAAVPTRTNVLRALHELAGAVPEDGRAMVLFAFTGRGAAAAGKAYLLPKDAVVQAGDALLAATAIDFAADVRRRFADRGLEQVVLLLDTTLTAPAGGSSAALPEDFVAATSARAMGTGAAVAVVHATAPGAASYLDPATGRPVFTSAVVEGIRGAAPRTTDGWITLGSLLRYVQETVPERARAAGARRPQSPAAEVSGIAPHEVRFARARVPSVSTADGLRCGLRGEDEDGDAFAFEVETAPGADATVESVSVVSGGVLRAPFTAPVALDGRRTWAVLRRGGRPLLAVARTSIGECAAYVEPAPSGAPVYAERWVAMNAEGVPYREVFEHATENRRGRTDVVATGRDTLRDRGGRITKVEYSCQGAACGWSRHPEASRGYAADVTVQAPASFSWRRRWEGEAAIDVYTVHYEMPLRVCVSGCGSNTLD